MSKLLHLGGIKDGEWIDVEDRLDSVSYIKVECTSEPAPHSCDPFKNFEFHVYTRIIFKTLFKEVSVMVFETVPPICPLERLIAGYSSGTAFVRTLG